jgi:hypothetical protein
VPNALAPEFAFVLGKAQDHVQVQSPDRRRRVEVLRNADQRDLAAFKDIDQPDEITQ